MAPTEDDFDKFQTPISVAPAPALPGSSNSNEVIGGGGGGVPLGGVAGHIDFNKPGDPLGAASVSNEPRLAIGPDPVDRAPVANTGNDLSSTPHGTSPGRILRQRRPDYDERAQLPGTNPTVAPGPSGQAAAPVGLQQPGAPAEPAASAPSSEASRGPQPRITTKAELQARVRQADALLAKNLPPGDRLKVAKLKLLDQMA